MRIDRQFLWISGGGGGVCVGLGGGIFWVDGAECTFFIGEWGWLWVDGAYFG